MSCEDCAKPAAAEKGTFWTGEPAGKEVKLNGVDVYLAQPASPNGKAVIMIPDVYGWDAKNARLYADKLAASGLTAALPDYFRDDPPDMAPVAKGDYTEFMKWRGRHGPDAVLPDTEKVIDSLKADYGITSTGVIGFCWGGKFAAMLGTGDKVKAVVVNHGSFVDDAEVAGAKQATMFNGSDNDQQISRERLAEIGTILKDRAGVPSDVKLFDGAKHGWTVRGDDKDPEVAPKIVEAFERARDWFLKHL